MHNFDLSLHSFVDSIGIYTRSLNVGISDVRSKYNQIKFYTSKTLHEHGHQ